MNTSFEPNDELCRLWRELEPLKSKKEVSEIMELVAVRANQFARTIFWRNVREYTAAVIVTVLFGFIATQASTPMERLGHAIVSGGSLWILVFLWLMQRSREAPAPEASSEAYQRALLRQYDRQILLTRTAWAWYVLPLTTGLVISSLGNEHAPMLGLGMAGFLIAVGVAIAVLNWKAATQIAAEKHDLQQMLDGSGTA